MIAYRAEPCAFCDLASMERCPRCKVPVCPTHGRGDGPHCALCAKELKDDLDVASFGIAVHEPPPDSGGLFPARRDTVAASLAGLVRTVRAIFVKRRARRRFQARTPQEIVEWRRKAGVRLRE